MADPVFDIPGLENIDMNRTADDTRPDWFDGPEMTEDDPAFKDIVAQMAEAGWAVPEKLPEPTELVAAGGDDDADAPAEDAPAADPELPPVYDETPPAAEPPAADAPVRSELINVEIDGQDYEINQEQAAYLLQMNSWIEQVPVAIKEQWAGIQDGTHVAITQEQLAQFQAAQQAASATPAVSPNRPDIDDLDDDTAAYIRELEGRAQPVSQQPPTIDQGPSPQEMQAAATAQANERVRLNATIGEVTAAYAEEYGLDEAQVQRLQQVTSELGVVPAIQRRHRVYSPTGQMIRDADFGTVVKEAYGVAMSTDPELSKAHAEHIYQARLAQESEANRAVAAKKGRAGSLAAAPSAAVPAGNNTPKIGANNQMDVSGTANAIAQAIAAASNGS
jgi:hypothetical protein